MKICVEDGTGLETSNSYVGIQYFIDYARARGFSIPSSTQEISTLSFRAVDHIESLSHKYSGVKVSSTQALSYPREDSYIDQCELIGNDVVPLDMKRAQCELMLSIYNGYDPTKDVSDKPFVTEKMVGPIRQRYAQSSQDRRNKSTMGNAFLRKLMKNPSNIRVVKL